MSKHHRGPLLMLAGGLAVVAAALPVAPSFAAVQATPRALPRSVSLTGGMGALYSQYQVIAASGAAVLLETNAASGNGDLNDQLGYSVLLDGKSVPTPIALAAGAQSLSLDGTMVVAGEYTIDRFLYAVWHDDAGTGLVGTTDVGADTTLVGASPVGFVTLRNGLKVQETNVLTGQTSTLTDFTGGPDIPSVVLLGPLGIAIEYFNQVTGTSAVGYVHYSDPGHLEPVIAPTFGNLVCQSVTTNAVGCYLLGNGPLEVVRAPIPSGKWVTFSYRRLRGENPAVYVTPTSTVWIPDSGLIRSLRRLPATGGTNPYSITLPPVETRNGLVGGTPVAFGGYSIYFAPQVTEADSGSIFELTSNFTSSTVPVRLAPSRLAPVAAATCAVSGRNVSWIDDSVPGLALLSRSFEVNGATVELSTKQYIAETGFSAHQQGLALQLAEAGSTIAYTGYNRPRDSGSVWIHLGGKNRLVSPELQYAVGSSPSRPYLASLSFSGPWLLYSVQSPSSRFATAELLNTVTGQRSALPAGPIAYGLGSGTLAWIDANGSVWEEPVGTSSSVELAPASPMNSVLTVLGLAVGGGYVAWDYSWGTSFSPSYASGYVDVTTHGPTEPIPNANTVTALTLSDEYLGVTTVGSNGWVIPLNPTGAERLVARGSTDLSISGSVACWIGAKSHLPYLAEI